MLNVILKNTSQSPFNSFLFTGHVLDEKGNKMSKSLGNVVDAFTLLRNNPVDLVRFYFMWKSSPIEPLNFETNF
jgi:isoleucyl-tRNA synthetase